MIIFFLFGDIAQIAQRVLFFAFIWKYTVRKMQDIAICVR